MESEKPSIGPLKTDTLTKDERRACYRMFEKMNLEGQKTEQIVDEFIIRESCRMLRTAFLLIRNSIFSTKDTNSRMVMIKSMIDAAGLPVIMVYREQGWPENQVNALIDMGLYSRAEKKLLEVIITFHAGLTINNVRDFPEWALRAMEAKKKYADPFMEASLHDGTGTVN